MNILVALFAAAHALAALAGPGLVVLTLAVASRLTRALPPRGGIADLGAARLHSVEGGHMLLASQPDLVAGWIRGCAACFAREPAKQAPELRAQRSTPAATSSTDSLERSAP